MFAAVTHFGVSSTDGIWTFATLSVVEPLISVFAGFTACRRYIASAVAA